MRGLLVAGAGTRRAAGVVAPGVVAVVDGDTWRHDLGRLAMHEAAMLILDDDAAGRASHDVALGALVADARSVTDARRLGESG